MSSKSQKEEVRHLDMMSKNQIKVDHLTGHVDLQGNVTLLHKEFPDCTKDTISKVLLASDNTLDAARSRLGCNESTKEVLDQWMVAKKGRGKPASATKSRKSKKQPSPSQPTLTNGAIPNGSHHTHLNGLPEQVVPSKVDSNHDNGLGNDIAPLPQRDRYRRSNHGNSSRQPNSQVGKEGRAALQQPVRGGGGGEPPAPPPARSGGHAHTGKTGSSAGGGGSGGGSGGLDPRRTGGQASTVPAHPLEGLRGEDGPGRDRLDSTASTGSGGGAGGGDSSKRLLKDLTRCHVSLSRHQTNLEERCDASSRLVRQVFSNLKSLVVQREEELLGELERVRREGASLLAQRREAAAALRAQAEQGLTNAATGPPKESREAALLRSQIKAFIADRKVDEEIGSVSRFRCDPDPICQQVSSFGTVPNLHHTYNHWPYSDSKSSQQASTAPRQPLPASTAPRQQLPASLPDSGSLHGNAGPADKRSTTNAQSNKRPLTTTSSPSDKRPIVNTQSDKRPFTTSSQSDKRPIVNTQSDKRPLTTSSQSDVRPTVNAQSNKRPLPTASQPDKRPPQAVPLVVTAQAVSGTDLRESQARVRDAVIKQGVVLDPLGQQGAGLDKQGAGPRSAAAKKRYTNQRKREQQLSAQPQSRDGGPATAAPPPPARQSGPTPKPSGPALPNPRPSGGAQPLQASKRQPAAGQPHRKVEESVIIVHDRSHRAAKAQNGKPRPKPQQPTQQPQPQDVEVGDGADDRRTNKPLSARRRKNRKPKVPSEDQLKPEVTSEDQLKPEVTSENQVEPEVKFESQVEPEVTSENQVEPEVTSENQLEQEVTSEDQLKPEVKSENQVEPEVKSESQVEPEVTSENQVEPEVTSEDQLKQEVTSENQVEPEVFARDPPTDVGVEGKERVDRSNELSFAAGNFNTNSSNPPPKGEALPKSGGKLGESQQETISFEGSSKTKLVRKQSLKITPSQRPQQQQQQQQQPSQQQTANAEATFTLKVSSET